MVKGSSGKRFKLTKYLLKLYFLVKRIKSNMLNVKGLAIEDETNSVQFNFFLNIKIFLYLNLFPL